MTLRFICRESSCEFPILCILKLRNAGDVQIGDQFSSKTGTIVPEKATIEITKMEGNQAVGDFAKDADWKSIKSGQAFYRWTEK